MLREEYRQKIREWMNERKIRPLAVHVETPKNDGNGYSITDIQVVTAAVPGNPIVEIITFRFCGQILREAARMRVPFADAITFHHGEWDPWNATGWNPVSGKGR